MAELYCENDIAVDLDNNTSANTDWVNKVVSDDANYDYNSVFREWRKVLYGQKLSKSYITRKRRIEKVPQLLRREGQNKRDYDPSVVSLGPYHHKKQELRLGEMFKQRVLQMYVSDSGKNIADFKQNVLEVIGIARSCYVDGSTDSYNDEEFAQMMLLDGCFILSYIDYTIGNDIHFAERFQLLMLDHLGGLGLVNVIRDIFLLENQLPYQVLRALMSVKYSEAEWEVILNGFFINQMFGARVQDEQPQSLHLLEIYRTYFLSHSGLVNQPLIQHSHKSPWYKLKKKFTEDTFSQYHDYKKYVKSFRSVTELKTKGIRFRPRSHSKSPTNIKFKSYGLCGQLEIPPVIINPVTKAIFLNLFAYEMCPHTPNNARVTSYLDFMKSLINYPADVKELRSKRILLNYIGSDEDVVKMFEEMSFPIVNPGIFEEVRQRIEDHYNSKTKTWMAELISKYFSSPWTALALLAAIFLLNLTVIQTYFTISPRSDK